MAVQRERSRSPLNLVVSPASRRSTDSVEPSTPVSDHAPPTSTSAAPGATPAVPPSAASTRARLHDFFSVTDTSAGALEVCTVQSRVCFRVLVRYSFISQSVSQSVNQSFIVWEPDSESWISARKSVEFQRANNVHLDSSSRQPLRQAICAASTLFQPICCSRHTTLRRLYSFNENSSPVHQLFGRHVPPCNLLGGEWSVELHATGPTRSAEWAVFYINFSSENTKVLCMFTLLKRIISLQ